MLSKTATPYYGWFRVFMTVMSTQACYSLLKKFSMVLFILGTSVQAADSPSCFSRCRSCFGFENCSQICERVGACSSTNCKAISQCLKNNHWDDQLCKCVSNTYPESSPSSSHSTQCGSTTCNSNEYCCNPSCGVCAPLGGVCTQQFCGAVNAEHK